MSFGLQGISDPTAAAQQQQSAPSLQPFANLDLSEQQRTQIRSIFQSAQSGGLSQSQVQDQINAVLTPAQQQTLQSDVQTAQGATPGHHHHHHHGAGGSSSASSGQTTSAGTSTAASSSSASGGLTESAIQNQVLAATSINQQQLQSEVLSG